ncbi:uncharacterized protein LOC134819945 [Bolinopsis microptera]|uniref:uncharacterized protein LOC134819945 n=1 Tax=Bolinopsis microptera TaxID=2820187 RepID=UPI003078CE60
MRLERVVLLLWLPACLYSLHCRVGEIVRNTVLDRDEGRTVMSDCAVFWPTANNAACKKFKYRVVNYSKVYYACGHCDGSGNGEGQMEFGPYAISKSLTSLNVTKPDPKIKVEEGECVTCTEDLCFEHIPGRDFNAGIGVSVTTSLLLSTILFYFVC